MESDTIAAIATASGKGGIGIVRISGKNALAIAKKITRKILKPRYAQFCDFNDKEKKIDEGIAIFFPNPHSFTGEDVVELQGHGSSIALNLILKECVSYGARLARPGEFSERAFLNDKIDLVQAEAIADIIESTSVNAAQSAVRSLSGEFSNKINALTQQLINLRIYIEASIDFPEEDIEDKESYISNDFVFSSLNQLIKNLNAIWQQAKTGVIIRDGLSAIIVGEPNTGKSSLLNSLASDDLAIVNKQAGTTRDTLKETLNLDGLTLRIIDTAGLRQSSDEIEQEGIRRVKEEIKKVDIVLFMRDISVEKTTLLPDIKSLHSLLNVHQITLPEEALLIVINNKIDLKNISASTEKTSNYICISLSAKEKKGIDLLTLCLKDHYGLNNTNEDTFVARTRHLKILEETQILIEMSKQQLITTKAGELLAEDLRQAQQLLGKITGQFSSDDLLGEIFSSFCIGK